MRVTRTSPAVSAPFTREILRVAVALIITATGLTVQAAELTIPELKQADIKGAAADFIVIDDIAGG